MAAKHKIYSVHGFTGTLHDLAEYFGINHRTLYTRLRLGWSVEMAVDTPVDKLKSTKSGYIFEIGKFRAVPNKIESRFGVYLDTRDRANGSRIVRKIQKYRKPVFYTIDNYKGSLIAISADYNCPISTLKAGLKDGKDIVEVLKENRCYPKV